MDTHLKYIQSLPKSVRDEARNEMVEIYEAILYGDGEDVLLSSN